jgi:hypothetical protein
MPKLNDKPNPQQHETNGKQHNYARVFEEFGVSFGRRSSDEVVADACPWCGKDRFYLNVTNGLYDCKHCDASGNVTTYLTWIHGQYLGQTTAEDYLRLKAKRGIASQTLKLHQLAYARDLGCWVIPFKNGKGNVVNIMRYWPDRPKGKGQPPNKLMLPELPTALYGFDKLVSADKDKPVLLCEGPFDAIALDYDIGATHRARYVIVAAPGAFKEDWTEHFEGRKVLAAMDNDGGGEKLRERLRELLGEGGKAELRLLKWPEGHDGHDVNDLVRLPAYQGHVLGFLTEHCFAVTVEPKLDFEHGWARERRGPPVIDWLWPDHLRCGTYVSFSGQQGTLKSSIARELVARYTTGARMPLCTTAGLPPGHAIYITAEDDKETVWADLERLGAGLNKVTVMKATLRDGDPMNVLEHQAELERLIKEHGTRLVIIDGQNSVVGAPNISTDMLARHNVTNKLHRFAQKLKICLIGIRNEDADGRAYGPASMGDLGRCMLRAVELEPKGEPPYYQLVFVKVSDTARKNYPPIPYSVQDLGGPARKILWGKVRPQKTAPEAMKGAAGKKGVVVTEDVRKLAEEFRKRFPTAEGRP